MTNENAKAPGRAAGLAVGLIMALGSATIPSLGSAGRPPVSPQPAADEPTPQAARSAARVSPDDEALLAQLRVAAESPRAGYRRSSFRHWVDADGDGCDARQEVLIAESQTPPELEPDCDVISGKWFSEYDEVNESVPRRLDVDHMVPLAEAWDSGASEWDPERREDYANNLDQTEALIAVTASSNRSKGDKDPFEWMPPRKEFKCSYLRDWVKVKVAWELTADPDEAATLRSLFAGCPS